MQKKVSDQVGLALDNQLKMIRSFRKQMNEEAEEDTKGTPKDSPNFDQEAMLVVLTESFQQVIGVSPPNLQAALGKVKESYDEILSSIVESLSYQIEYFQQEGQKAAEILDDQAAEIDRLTSKVTQSDQKSKQTALAFTKENETLSEEVSKLQDENKYLRKQLQKQEIALLK